MIFMGAKPRNALMESIISPCLCASIYEALIEDPERKWFIGLVQKTFQSKWKFKMLMLSSPLEAVK